MKGYESHYKIAETFPDYEVKLGLSLHSGWAIEGPIGSDFKVDASYLSPHVNLCMSLGALTKTYEVSLLLSERIYTLLSLRTKERIRKVDVVKFESKPTGLFTYTVTGQAPAPPDDHKLGEVIKVDGLDVTAQAIEKDGAEYIFLVDQDVVQLQQGVSEEMLTNFRQGLTEYCSGEWGEAQKYLEKALEHGEDGPSRFLLKFMGRFEFEAPADWDGSRDLAK